jgi:spermidine synthase
MLAALAVAFVLSGAAGLVYESIWSRYIGLFVGHSAYAQILVLVIFMGGMAAGALLVGRRSERLRDPLRLYALVEIVIGLIGILFHPIFVGATHFAYAVLFPAVGETAMLPVLKWGLAGLLILPQSILLGATFPLMSAGVVRRVTEAPGRVVALLYFANSLGAAVGVLASGFWLVRVVGLPGTLGAAAALNFLVGGLILAIVRAPTPKVTTEAVAARPAEPSPWRPAAAEPGGPEWLPRLMIAVSFGTAVASFVYEIAWIRMLALVLGSATHSFELMLSAFILGLALGAGWVRRVADRLREPLRFLGWTQWVMGAMALATLPLYMTSFEWMANLVNRLQEAPRGYEVFSIARYGICLAVMLPATFCAGITLPLLTKILMTRGGKGERAIGAIYGANTLGSILGASMAGLVLLPWLGLERLLAAGAALDISLGIALLAAARRESAGKRWPVYATAAAGLAVVIGVPGLVRLDKLRLVSGVYRTGIILQPSESEVIFYRDGRTATVSVRRQPAGDLTLSTNGKPDASLAATWLEPDPNRPQSALSNDESTQLLTGLIPLAHASQAHNAAVIGIGSGMTSHVLLGSPRLKRLLTIEIEPQMIEAARLFRPANRRVFEDRRSSFVVDDARSYFAASRERFDLIVSEPSNPWVSGVAGLFTDEFYGRMREALTDDGVLGQWLQLYALDDDLVLSVLSAVARNFSNFRMYLISSSDIIIVATNRKGGFDPDWGVVRDPGVAEDLAKALPLTTPVLDALWIADREALAPLLERSMVNSDFRPVLDLGAERTRFRNAYAPGLMVLHFDRFSLAAVNAPRVAPLDSDRQPLPYIMRVRGLMWVARMRDAVAGRPPLPDDLEVLRRKLGEAMARMHKVRLPAETGQAPSDWRLWLADAINGEDDLHRGTTGYADTGYFDALRGIARRASAPSHVFQAIDWMEALERRDFVRASALTDTLVAEHEAGRGWMYADLLLDGGTTAKLVTGDVEGARRVLRSVRPAVQRSPFDLRLRLIEAHVGGP